MKGYYRPKHPAKYKGDPMHIIYRSSWEKRCMIHFDNNSNILEWQSEEFFVPYRSPIDGKLHRYFPDFWIKMKNREGQVEVRLIEVKPYHQTQEPKKQTRKTKKYINEVKTYGINIYKWKAAREYCADRGWTFQILTERELGLDKPRKS